MGELYLDSRLRFLLATQNPDGGWGYFPGKQSWFEPTTYAMLALHDTPGSETALADAWKLLRSWQLADGSSRPNGQVGEGTWVTAHAVTLACVRGVRDDRVKQGIGWLLGVSGIENHLTMRLASALGLLKTKLDVSHPGWPWLKGNASWIEPTAHTLVALKKAAANFGSRELEHRVHEGEALVLGRRCSDGGWNAGNPNVLNFDLPSYPETTALALIGLGGRSEKELAAPLALAQKLTSDTKSSLARAWLAIALRIHGRTVDLPQDRSRTSEDIMLAALEALGHPAGNFRLLAAGGLA